MIWSLGWPVTGSGWRPGEQVVLHPVLVEFEELTDTDPGVRAHVHRSDDRPGTTYQGYSKRHLQSAKQLLRLINEVLTTAPELSASTAADQKCRSLCRIGLRSTCGRISRATRITRSVADSRFGTALLGNSPHSGRRPVRDDSGVFCKAGLWGSSPSVKTLALPHRPSSNVLDVFLVRFESVDQSS
jgi:hypothetical protein